MKEETINGLEDSRKAGLGVFGSFREETLTCTALMNPK